MLLKMTLKTSLAKLEKCVFLIKLISLICSYTEQLHNAMKESSSLFDDGQPWGEETEDGIMHNKVPYFTINISRLILFTKCVIIEITIVFCKTCLFCFLEI